MIAEKVDKAWKAIGTKVFWSRINGRPQVKDIEELLDSLKEVVTKPFDNTDSLSVESGGILVKNSDGHIDVYIHVGELT